MNQNKNIKIYSIQKTYKIEQYHKVTSYANSTSLFTAYDTKFVNRKLFEPTEDIIKTAMKPFGVALISLLFNVIFTHVIAIGWTSVCPSVCTSVTRWYCIKTAEHIVMLSSPHHSPFILVLCTSRSSRNFDGITACGAAKQRWGMKMLQFSTNNLLYFRNG